jgi:putative membrane-bound dehydrogenase-like protein
MNRCLTILCVLTISVICLPLAADDFPEIYNSESERNLQPMPADEAAETMQVPEGFSVSVFAAEPDVQNPIAMNWDERGRLWVAENFTYSDRTQRFDLSLRDRVLIFEDRDHDGRADSRKVFTDRVQMLTSVEVGRGGVWLMCPPQLLFIPDENQDDIPDGPARVVLDGFEVAQANYHNFANGLKWGPDGWLYGRCGHSCPGKIGPPGTADEDRALLDGGIWRYHPDRKVVEVLCHGTVNPWGHDWDQNGELFFINTVIGHLWHVMPGAHFKESFGESQNPRVYERLDTVADHYHFDTKGKWSDSRDGHANELGGGHAHIGMMIYQADQWPKRYRGKLFTLNMHGRRANVDRLERLGAGYVGRHEPDFCIAADPFFRGIDLNVGPDGNVYMIDWSDTGECHEHNGVHRTSGRIFKISYGNSQTIQSVPKPFCLGGEGVLPKLWRQYQDGETTRDQLLELLDHPDEHVRAWAIRLLTDFWPLDTIVGPLPNAQYPDDPEIRNELIRLARNDESGLVHLVLASTLQRLPVQHRAALAAELIRHERYAGDRDLPSLVWYGLIPLSEHDPYALVELESDCRWPRLVRWMTRAVASDVDSDPRPLDLLLKQALKQPAEMQFQALLGMNDTFTGWRKAPQPEAWTQFVKGEAAAKSPELIRKLNILFGDGHAVEEIRKIVFDKNAELKTRQQALETLIEARPDDLRSVCESVLNVRVLNGTAVKGLALFDDPEIGTLLSRNYNRFHPDDRPGVLETLIARPVFAHGLLDSIADGRSRIPVSDITAVHARQIRSLDDESLTKKLAKVWGELRETPAERKALMAELREQLTPDVREDADLSAGRVLFNKSCANCHRLYGAGKPIGPDLTGSQRSNLDYLLENLIDPSAVVGKDYRMSIVVTRDGRVLNGLVVKQDDKTLVLQTHTEQVTIPVADVEQQKKTTLSPMPDGLLEKLSQKQLRDLFGYLMHPQQVPLPEEGE